MGPTCEHLNKLADVLDKELLPSKEALQCGECGSAGPNLWLCLQPDCRHIGCSENHEDHSTSHQRKLPWHCVHINVSTQRVWCYLCEREVHVAGALAAHKQWSSDSWAAGGAAGDEDSDSDVAAAFAQPDDEDELPPDDEGDLDMGDRPKGLVGLQNVGNTCYMNAALQALAHTPPFAAHFRLAPPLCGDKPGLARAYHKLVQEMWNQKTRGYVAPNGILYGIRSVHPMFRGYHQHDAQEFLRCFLDQLHEELKEPAGEPPAPASCRPVKLSGEGGGPARRRGHCRSPSAHSLHERPQHANQYHRVQTVSESGRSSPAPRHRRSASYSGYAPLPSHDLAPEPQSQEEGFASPVDSSRASSGDERFETCSEGEPGDAAPARPASTPPKGERGDGAAGAGARECEQGARYRSIVSDAFDGKLLSSVQCLTCDRVSTRVETFQDLSLPIPSREHVAALRAQQPASAPAPAPPPSCSDAVYAAAVPDSWVWWLLGWLRAWLYGPAVSLQDCLAAFFSADELKGDNMYSCSRCNKLRNGVKVSRVARLPEVLCIHLKRFRHDLAAPGAKVGARVAFPLRDLDMRPYTRDVSQCAVTQYELTAVVCHAGTAGGGHYTCLARAGRSWYEFDDQCVTRVSPQRVAAAEAYVLFYRKSNPAMAQVRGRAAAVLASARAPPPAAPHAHYYVCKQWINKFRTWGEPGAVDNTALVCRHGALRPERAALAPRLAARLPAPLWHFLHDRFGGGPACAALRECGACARAAERLRRRQARELLTFLRLHQRFQEQESARGAVFALSAAWLRRWQDFVRERSPQPPPPIDNRPIAAHNNQELSGGASGGGAALRPDADHVQLSEHLWRFFLTLYGGGPEIMLRSAPCERSSPQPDSSSDGQPPAPTPRRAAPPRVRNYSDSSDHEDIPPPAVKSASTAYLPDTRIVSEPGVKNAQSLQNVTWNPSKMNGHRRGGADAQPQRMSCDSDEEEAAAVRPAQRPPRRARRPRPAAPPACNAAYLNGSADTSEKDSNDNNVDPRSRSPRDRLEASRSQTGFPGADNANIPKCRSGPAISPSCSLKSARRAGTGAAGDESRDRSPAPPPSPLGVK